MEALRRNTSRWQRFLKRCIEEIGIHVFVRAVGMFASLCRRLGLLRFEGLEHFRETLERGNAMIIVNHPTMLETALIPVAAYPLLLREHFLLPWSIADQNILPPILRWVFPLVRIITIDRRDAEKIVAGERRRRTVGGILHGIELLREGGSLVIYPGGGRDAKGKTFVSFGKRKMREFEPTVCAIARKTNALILPTWVEFENVPGPLSLYRALLWLFRGNRMTICFGEPYRLGVGSIEAERQELMRRVLRAGAAEA